MKSLTLPPTSDENRKQTEKGKNSKISGPISAIFMDKDTSHHPKKNFQETEFYQKET